MKFFEFSKYLEKLEVTSSRLEITAVLAELLRHLDADEIEPAVFLSLGVLGPKYDQPDFGVSDKLMIRVIARAFSKKDEDVLKLFKKVGDLGSVAQELVIKNLESRSGISIGEVFEKLKGAAEAGGAGSQEKKISLLAKLINELDPVSVRYVIRIPLGTMRLGFSEKTVLEALTLVETGEKEASFAKGSASREVKSELEERFEVYPNIGEIARVFKSEGLKGLKSIHLRVGVPVSPQLCQRLDDASKMIEKMGRVAAEYKYDGTRLQIHLDREIRSKKQKVGSQIALLDDVVEGPDERVRMYTRNMERVEAMFPDVAESVVNDVKAATAVLDGEAVGYDRQTGKLLPFQETIQRKRKYDVAEMSKKIPVKYYVFDILLKDGKDLTGLPLFERRRILKETIKKDRDSVLLSEELVTDDPEKLQEYFLEVKKKGLEGLVVKKYDGPYEAGNRGFSWVKFKREECGEALSDTVDLVVLGYNKGTGKRADFGIGAFLAGIYDEENDRFLTVAKIGTGLTDEEWRDIRIRIQESRIKEVPRNVEISKELSPDVICKPEIVVAVRADEITVSPTHSSGYALRFPRMMAYRTDKDATQATTLKELWQMYKSKMKK
jgi:DNA ligase-1